MKFQISRRTLAGAVLAACLSAGTAVADDDDTTDVMAPDLTYPAAGETAPVIYKSRGEYNMGQPVAKLPGANDRHTIIDGNFRLRETPMAEKVVNIETDDIADSTLPGVGTPAPSAAKQSTPAVTAPAGSGDTLEMPAN